MAFNEIDTRTANFDEIEKFAMNLLKIRKQDHPGDYEAQIAYFAAQTQVILARRQSESAAKLAHEIDQARIAVGKGLDKLDRQVDGLTNAIAAAASSADASSRSMIRATWGLVCGTVILAIATVGLVWYTRELALSEAAPVSVSEPATSKESGRGANP